MADPLVEQMAEALRNEAPIWEVLLCYRVPNGEMRIIRDIQRTFATEAIEDACAWAEEHVAENFNLTAVPSA